MVEGLRMAGAFLAPQAALKYHWPHSGGSLGLYQTPQGFHGALWQQQ